MTGKTMAVVPSWIEAHCIVPDGFRKGAPFRLYDYQLLYLANFYLVRDEAIWHPANPVKAPAFVYRRAILVGPQKLGKNPLIATQVCVEGVGPALFAGWAGKDEGYVCREHGCRCGWEYAYDEGEPKGMSWPTPLIQITAYSEDQTANTYRALRPMIDDGPLADLIPQTGEEFIRLPGGGRIDTVTSSAKSRLGQPVTFAPQDEVALYTPRSGMVHLADTQYRGLAGMGGRASLTTNPWDPAENSIAQREYASGATDVYRQFPRPPANLSYTDKRERHRIHQFVYPPDTRRENGGHVDLDSIEAEAADLITKDEPQAKRYFGQQLVKGGGRAFDVERWKKLAVSRPKKVPKGALITLGFDGARFWDATALIATEVASGYQWPLGIWARPENAESWEVPEAEVTAAVRRAFKRWDVWRLYADPPFWETTVSAWAGEFVGADGKSRVYEWWTNSHKKVAYAIRGWYEAQRAGDVSHCAAESDDPDADALCRLLTLHVGNASRKETGYRDDGGVLWVIEKDAPASPDKIDGAMAALLSWEARNDAIAAGALNVATEESAWDTPHSLTV